MFKKKLSMNVRLLYLISYFVIIDLLFLPYFPLITMPYSLPLIILFLLFVASIKKDRFLIIFFIIYITVLISVFLSISNNNPAVYTVENVKRAFQFLSSFAYFFFFKFVFSKINLNFKTILLFFSLYIFLLITIFMFEPELYVNITNFLYPLGGSEIGEFLYFLRFDYLFPDPNTAGYFILLVLFFGIQNINFNMYERFFLIFVSILTVIATKSTGVTLAAILFIGYYLLKFLKGTRISLSSKKIIIPMVFISALLLFFYFSDTNVRVISQSFEGYTERLTNTDGEGRISIYANVFNNFFPSVFGRGYSLINNGNFVKPHSDHLRMIYSYGIICYIAVIYFFSKTISFSKSAFLIPALIAFSINTLIDEQKFLGIFLVFIAYTYVYYKNKKDKSYIRSKRRSNKWSYQ